jgi:hypothetical protein
LDDTHASSVGLSRREFFQQSGFSIASVALTGLTWSSLSAAAVEAEAMEASKRKPLMVKPVLTYETPIRRPQTSWRSWGGIETEEQAREEQARIQQELATLRAAADFPLEFLPTSTGKNAAELAKIADAGNADLILVYAAGGTDPNLFAPLVQKGKDLIYFLRHSSGPLSFWYEAISPWYLHGNKSDQIVAKEIDGDDIVVDSVDELTWRLRALGGLKNARGTKIMAIGGAGGWGAGGGTAPGLAKEKWKIDIQTVTYDELAKLMKAAFADAEQVRRAQSRAAEYLGEPGVKLEIDKKAVENAFLLEHVFRLLMAQAGAQAMTISGCMATVMPIAQTSACLALSTLNDDGYLAFCESDFVVIPAGMLLARISGRPHFLNDPTFPHGGVITLAHCTAPRKMDGKSLDPVRIVTHFESDYGAAPKVEFRKGQKVTSIIPDFAHARWVGLLGEVASAPFLPVCRAQMDISYKVSDRTLIENMPGFHWETIYGDYLREVGYALKKTPIKWVPLG